MGLQLQEGDLLLERYRIEHVVGQGGMAVVVSALCEETGRRVAIKYLTAEALQDPNVTQRFEREARAAARLTSRHVPVVIESGKVDGSFFLVMELLQGRDLEHLLGNGEPIAIARAVDIMLMACDAMAEAHSLGIVHRDLKPANLFLVDDAVGPPVVKVLDFGLSKSLGPNTISVGLTGASEVFGSPFYMSPEQLISSAKVDARTDIWALGVILFETFTGRPPFEAEAMTELWSAIMLDEAPAPSTFRADLPRTLDEVVLRCLAKSPDARFRTVADLAEALAPFGSDVGRRCAGRARELQPVGFEPPSSLRQPVVAPPSSRREAAAKPVPRARSSRPQARLEVHGSTATPAPSANSSMLPPYLRRHRSRRSRQLAWVVFVVLALAAVGYALQR